MADAKYRLVSIGDSLTHGFMSGAIHRTDISYPAFIANALGVSDQFLVPDFSGEGGLPLNLERVLNVLSKHYGREINWWEVLPLTIRLQRMLDATEDYWERGRGSLPFPQRAVHHNLAVWGFEVRDAYTVTEGVCRRAIPKPKDNAFGQIPEMPMYRSARRVLNPTFANDAMEWHQVRCAKELALDGGIENLVVFLGANNVLGTVTSLSVKYSEPPDLHRLPHERTCNLYLPQHFETLYVQLADGIDSIGAQRVFVGTVPHVTIPPVSRGVSPDKTFVDGYFEYYTRPWVWDDVFDKGKHPHLTRDQVRMIDNFIDGYNDTIKSIAKQRGWKLVDTAKTLTDLAYRRSAGAPTYKFPAGLVEALKKHPPLKYLVGPNNTVRLDTRYISANANDSGKLLKGGLFSLDGIHPTTIGYGIVADLFIKKMKQAKVSNLDHLDWNAVVRADSLINRPPEMIGELKSTLAFLDQRGLLSDVFRLFSS